jgi:plastocyanin
LKVKLPINRTSRFVVGTAAAFAAVSVPAPLAAGQTRHRHSGQPRGQAPASVKATPPAQSRTPPSSQAPTRASHAKLKQKVHQAPGSRLSVPTNRDRRSRLIAAHLAGDPAVSIVDYSFKPATITIHVGDSITWTNNGKQPHTATANNGSFDTGTIQPGHSASHTFSQAGTFAYICTIHPFMHGTVVVVANSSSSGSGGSGGGSGGSGAGGSGAGGSGGGGSGGSGGGGGGGGTGATSANSTGDSTQSTSTGTSGSTLPNTGLDLSAAVLVALGMIGTGLAIRRRLRQT